MEIHIVTVVWGEEFILTFLELVFPLHIENLKKIKNTSDWIYRIFTTNTGKIEIENNCFFSELKTSGIVIEFIEMAEEKGENKYRRMSKCHDQALEYAYNRKAGFFLLSPDTIFSNDAFANVLSLVESGKRAVFVASIRLCKESFVKEWKFFDVATMTSRDLVGLALQHLHPVTKSLFWGKNFLNTNPSHLYWKLGQDGILVRGFNLHPFFLWPRKPCSAIHTTIDGEFVDQFEQNMDEVVVIEDSDEIAMFEVSRSFTFEVKKKSVKQLVDWASLYTGAVHRKFFQVPIYIRKRGVSFSWLTIQKESDAVVSQIQRRLSSPFTKIRLHMSLYWRSEKQLSIFKKTRGYVMRRMNLLKKRILKSGPDF
ncbi:MAG: hypothetical protein WCP39_02280 [Chlamydiota bacterium]